jgi:hypothetical protein
MGMGENVGYYGSRAAKSFVMSEDRELPTRHGGTSEQTAYQGGDELGGGLERVHGSCN